MWIIKLKYSNSRTPWIITDNEFEEILDKMNYFQSKLTATIDQH